MLPRSCRESSPCRWASKKRYKCNAIAGLWEFPGVKVAADASVAECKCKVDRLLEGPLGIPLAEEHVVSRQAVGQVVHIFSHIRMTMRVEHVVLAVSTARVSSTSQLPLRPPACLQVADDVLSWCMVQQGDIKARDREASEDSEDAAVRWLSKAQLEQEGLSSGVKKVYALVSQAKRSKTRGIKRFFKQT